MCVTMAVVETTFTPLCAQPVLNKFMSHPVKISWEDTEVELRYLKAMFSILHGVPKEEQKSIEPLMKRLRTRCVELAEIRYAIVRKKW